MSGFHSLLKSSNFQLTLKSIHKDIEFFVTEVNIPGITIGSMEMQYMSMSRKIPGDSLTFDNLTATVLVDEELKVLDEILSTIKFTHNAEKNTYTIDPVLFEANLFITSNKNNVKFQFTFHDAWIESFSELPFSSTTTDENNLSTTIGIRYNFYTFKRV